MIVGLVFFALGVWIPTIGRAGWARDGPQAGYSVAHRRAAAVCRSVVVQAYRRKSDTRVFVEWSKLVPVGKILFPLILYIAAMQYVGLYVASTLFVGALMRWLGRYSWTKAIIVPLIMSGIIFWLFEYQFTVPLPKGPLEQWFGY
jgi:hypothetical protein